MALPGGHTRYCTHHKAPRWTEESLRPRSYLTLLGLKAKIQVCHSVLQLTAMMWAQGLWMIPLKKQHLMVSGTSQVGLESGYRAKHFFSTK